jgi:hypothetical protein
MTPTGRPTVDAGFGCSFGLVPPMDNRGWVYIMENEKPA